MVDNCCGVQEDQCMALNIVSADIVCACLPVFLASSFVLLLNKLRQCIQSDLHNLEPSDSCHSVLALLGCYIATGSGFKLRRSLDVLSNYYMY